MPTITMLSDERRLAAENRFDVLQGAIVPAPARWTFRIDAASHLFEGNAPDDSRLLAGLSDDRSQARLSTLSYHDNLNRLAALERLLRSNGPMVLPTPWLTITAWMVLRAGTLTSPDSRRTRSSRILRAPVRLLALEADDQGLDLRGQPVGVSHRPPRAIGQDREPVLLGPLRRSCGSLALSLSRPVN